MPYRVSAATGAPTQTAFRESFLLALGRATCFEPFAALPLWLLTPATLKIFGIDPNNPEFPREGRKKGAEGLDRKIQVLAMYLRRQDKRSCRRNYRTTKLTVRGDERGFWALTPEGVARARQLDGLSPGQSVPNLTGRWLGERLTAPGGMENSRLYKAMGAAVASKCSVSAASQQVDDHISECLTRLIHRDSLRNRLMLDKRITDSHLCTYAVRSAWTDARNSATNPVCREMYGARTETERRKATEAEPPRRWHITDPRVTFAKNEDGVAQLLEIADDGFDEIVDNLHFESMWAQMLEAIRVGKGNKKKVYDRYIKVVMLKLQGGGTKDIALAMGVSNSRATSMLAEARRMLREAKKKGQFSDCFVSS